MYDALFSMLTTSHAQHFYGGVLPGRVGNRHPLSTPFGCFSTRDGQVVIAVLNAGQFERLAGLVGKPAIAADPRFATDSSRTEHEPELRALIEEWSGALTTEEAVAALSGHGLPTAPIWDIAQAAGNEHAARRGLVSELGIPCSAGRRWSASRCASTASSPWPRPLRRASAATSMPCWRNSDWRSRMAQIDDPWHMLSDEERLFCEVLERLCADKIAPLAAETDETSRFVHEQLAVLGEAGMMGANLPEDHGGGGISALALLRAVSIVAGACGSTASALTAHYLATDSILIGGSEAQKREWLPRAAAGEALGAFALTEPTAGSDPADMKTRAKRTETAGTSREPSASSPMAASPTSSWSMPSPTRKRRITASRPSSCRRGPPASSPASRKRPWA